jgi:hypothetical protein
MIQEVEWPYYYESKAARKSKLSVAFIRKLAISGMVRSSQITRKNGSTFYLICSEDFDRFMEEHGIG